MTVFVHVAEPGGGAWRAFARTKALAWQGVFGQASLPFARDEGLAQDHPFFGYGRGARFVAVRGRAPRARAAAYLNPHARNEADEPIGFIGHFEACEDVEASRAVLDAACGWLHREGAREAIGPVDFSTWHRYRLATSGDGSAPFFLEPHNPPWYPSLFESAGFVARRRYLSTWATDFDAVIARGARAAAELRPQGYRVRAVDLRRFDEELNIVYALSSAVFRDNAFATPCPPEEFRRQYAGARFLLERDLMLFAEDARGRPVGFMFGLRDLAPALRALGHRPTPRAALRALDARRRCDVLIAKTLGILPEHRRGGLGSWLVGELHERARRLGLHRSVHALMLDDNPSRHLARGLEAPLRTYTLYGRPLR